MWIDLYFIIFYIFMKFHFFPNFEYMNITVFRAFYLFNQQICITNNSLHEFSYRYYRKISLQKCWKMVFYLYLHLFIQELNLVNYEVWLVISFCTTFGKKFIMFVSCINKAPDSHYCAIEPITKFVLVSTELLTQHFPVGSPLPSSLFLLVASPANLAICLYVWPISLPPLFFAAIILLASD